MFFHASRYLLFMFFINKKKKAKEGAGEGNDWKPFYLYCMLKLLMLLLQLLSFLQRAGCDQAGIQHGLAITDPSQHLKHTDMSCPHHSCDAVVLPTASACFCISNPLNWLTRGGCHSIIVSSARLCKKKKRLLNTGLLSESACTPAGEVMSTAEAGSCL